MGFNMALKTGTRSMGRKKTALPSRSIRVHEDVYKDAVVVAAIKETDVMVLISEILRPILKQHKRELLRSEVEDDEIPPDV